MSRGGARLVPAPSLCPGSSNPWAAGGAARARAGELVCAASPPYPLSCRLLPVGRAGEVESRPGRPGGLTVGKVWLEEEVASSPGRWRPGLDRGARGLRAGSGRGRAPEPGLQPIPGASGTGLGRECGGGRENNSEVGERHRRCSRAASPPPALASRAPVEEPGPWSPLEEAVLEGLDARSGAASPLSRRQKLRDSFCSFGPLSMLPAILLLLLGKKTKRNSSPRPPPAGLSRAKAL